jgi:hypothetical protein
MKQGGLLPLGASEKDFYLHGKTTQDVKQDRRCYRLIASSSTLFSIEHPSYFRNEPFVLPITRTVVCSSRRCHGGVAKNAAFNRTRIRKEPHCFFVLTILLIMGCGLPMRVELGGFQGVLCVNITNRRLWPFPVVVVALWRVNQSFRMATAWHSIKVLN